VKMTSPTIRVVHVITTLATGGAELMLYRLLSRSRRDLCKHRVISLTGDGPVGARIRDLNIPVFPLDIRRLGTATVGLRDVARAIRNDSADILHTWLYHADLLGGLAGKLSTKAKIVWHIHHSGLTPPSIRPRTRQVARLCARLSRWIPDRIVCCSQAGMTTHSHFGFDQKRMSVIPNGFDVDEFRPDPSSRRRVRADLGLTESSVLVGMIARFSPFKDHKTFLGACSKVIQRSSNARFVLAGDGISFDNSELMGWIREAGITDRCLLLGRQNNVPELLSALDVLVSSSSTEAFPCIVGEAMASAVPCVVTDVGDSAILVADTGLIVRPADPPSLAAAIAEMIMMGAERRGDLGTRARKLVQANYSLSSVVARFETLYQEMHLERAAQIC
jgi:glycosyltransferase involved in cell wall biosynthesis